jgi:hypothetical protein
MRSGTGLDCRVPLSPGHTARTSRQLRENAKAQAVRTRGRGTSPGNTPPPQIRARQYRAGRWNLARLGLHSKTHVPTVAASPRFGTAHQEDLSTRLRHGRFATILWVGGTIEERHQIDGPVRYRWFGRGRGLRSPARRAHMIVDIALLADGSSPSASVHSPRRSRSAARRSFLWLNCQGFVRRCVSSPGPRIALAQSG